MYLQTWKYFPGNSWRGRLARYICLRLIGHDASKTESGWLVGADYEDRWCRWCGQKLKVPLGQFAFQYKSGRIFGEQDES